MAQTSSSSLERATMVGRAVVKWGVIALVAMIVGRVVISTFITFWKATHPPAPEPPTVGFGMLPAIALLSEAGAQPTSYSLELPTGRFPSFSDRAKVFFIPQGSASLLSDQQAKEKASRYDFVFEPEKIGQNTYRWTKSQPLGSTLEMNIITYQLRITTDFMSRPELTANPQLPDSFGAVQLVKSFLSTGNLLPADVATSSGSIEYQELIGGVLKPAYASDAEFIQVDLNRAPIDGAYEMYTPLGTVGTIHAILSGALSGNNAIVHLDYNYFPVDYYQVYTYPIRSPQSAWEILQAGEGYVVPSFAGEEAAIRSVELGYFDNFAYQPYLQPIYVFLGDEGFIGYVSAIDPSYIQPVAK
ncbi:MAG: hypothetical protein COU65_01050 [Candidatus Pacebacteria bacterium CG10_big_fil_rev_8_21_14_0_10_42_12]|nr:hypothetical protein [Candidatus Paceibacterota bacterium]PIR62895.1 MAG: hypothetical protein COU65_01050 [Candidatus Pacebacteria bacterium CG10_big_fil_rev_8_21_14_0_10_42_12]